MNDNESFSGSVNFKTDTSPLCQVLASKYRILISEVETPDLTVENVGILIEAFRAAPKYYSGNPKDFIALLCRKARVEFEYEWKVAQAYWKHCDDIDPPNIFDTFELIDRLAEYDEVLHRIELWSISQCLKVVELLEEACSQDYRFLNMSPGAIHALLRKEI